MGDTQSKTECLICHTCRVHHEVTIGGREGYSCSNPKVFVLPGWECNGPVYDRSKEDVKPGEPPPQVIGHSYYRLTQADLTEREFNAAVFADFKPKSRYTQTPRTNSKTDYMRVHYPHDFIPATEAFPCEVCHSGTTDGCGTLGYCYVCGAEGYDPYKFEFIREENGIRHYCRPQQDVPAKRSTKRARQKRPQGEAPRESASEVPLSASLAPEKAAGEYSVSGGQICRLRVVDKVEVESPLCNFNAWIKSQTTVDDGAEQSITLVIQGALANGTSLPPINVPAADFATMTWVIPGWGTRACVSAGMGAKDHLRAAIQLLSDSVTHRVIYSHLGWRQIDGKGWVYLHAGGAIGKGGHVEGVEVVPPPALARYVLRGPKAQSREDHVAAVKASLKLLDLAPDRVSFPLLGCVYRSVLGLADFILFLVGKTGAYKSEYTALAQQHFGPGMVRLALPASWSSTGNSLEGIAFACKDALLVIDEFVPSGNTINVAKMHQEFERMARAQGNSAGRQRMRADGSLRPEKPPRGMILSSGEDVPRGQSVRARVFTLGLGKGDIKSAKLSACQKDAAAGQYALAMSGFIEWLAPQFEDLRRRLPADRDKLRERATTSGQHARTPGIVADLAYGLWCLLDYATKIGAIDQAEKDRLWARSWKALGEAATAQAEHLADAEPTQHFVRLLSAALASGRAHLAGPSGGFPDNAQACGWRRDGTAWIAQGSCVGWIESDQLYLEPTAAYATAQALAAAQGESITVSPRTLWKRLDEAKMLASKDAGRQVLTVRKVLQGRRQNVLHLALSLLLEKPDQPDHGDENPLKNRADGGRVPPEEDQNPTTNPTTNPTSRSSAVASSGSANGQVDGQVDGRETGHSDTNPTSGQSGIPEGNGQMVGLVGFSARQRETGEKSGSYLAPGQTPESTATPFEE
jgi:hypothetical protein